MGICKVWLKFPVTETNLQVAARWVDATVLLSRVQTPYFVAALPLVSLLRDKRCAAKPVTMANPHFWFRTHHVSVRPGVVSVKFYLHSHPLLAM